MQQAVQSVRYSFSSDSLFYPNSDVLNEANVQPLRDSLRSIKAYNPIRVSIFGHSDSVGYAKYNRILTRKRAERIYDFALSQGMDSTSMHYDGKGFSNPISENNTAYGRKKNRRIEILFDVQTL